MRSRLGMRQAVLLFAVLALALGGCGTLSSLKSDSVLLTAPAGAREAPAEPVVAARAPEEGSATGSVGEPRAGEQTLVETVAFTPASLEAIESVQDPSYMVAFAGPLMVAQARTGEAAAPADAVLEEYDPWESFNEKMFTVNRNLDRYALKPAAKGYNFVMPDVMQQMVDNGFDNILVVQRVVNNLLQWRLKGVAIETGRFLINSTLGVGGLFDIAKQEFGLQRTKADFGQTLGIWGFGPGPYLVLPLLPPLTVRDGIGTAVDGAMDPLVYVLPFIWDRLGMKAGSTINERSLNLDLFQGFEETTVDLYSAVRNGYLQRRQNLIKSPPPY